MGNTTNQTIQAERMAQIGGISNHEFRNLQKLFIQASRGDMKLDFHEFTRFYSRLTGISSHGLDSKIMAGRVFKAIDLDNNRYISFDEFIIAYILLGNSGEPLNTKIQKFLACYFGGYIPDYINPSDSYKIQQSLNILCGIPMSSQPMSQTSYMGQIPQMGHGMHSGGMSSQMHQQSYSYGHQQMNGMSRDQFIHSITGNPGYASYFSY